MRAASPWVLGSLALAACSSFDEDASDASVVDAGHKDVAQLDGSHALADTGADVGPREDAHHNEAAARDTGEGEASLPDAAGHADAGVDAGSSDAGGCDGSSCAVELVMSGLSQASVIVVDSDNVYVSDPGTAAGSVYQCPKTGCTENVTLGSGQVTGIVVTQGSVYWSDSAAGTIVLCSIGGCSAPKALLTGQTEASGLSFDGTAFYWSVTGSVLTSTLAAGSTPSVLATGQGRGIADFATSAGVAYWINDLKLQACPVSGCDDTPKALAPAVGADVVVNAGTLYFIDNNAVMSCPASATQCNGRTVGSTFNPIGLATDGTYVYWLDQEENGVFRCRATGCPGGAETFADAPATFYGGIALDQDYVYWTATTEVLRKHK